MTASQLDTSSIALYPALLKDYLAGKESLRPFFTYSPDVEGLLKAIKNRTQDTFHRKVLVEVLRKAPYHTHSAQKQHILSLLDEDTFTVTTGHQLNLATGPLYVIYKLLAVVQLAKHMTDISGKKVVPVYWMATEDHDLEEIRSVQIFGKTYRWETEQTGAVGRMSPPSGIFWDQIPDCPEWLKNAYVQANTLSEAHGTIISYLLGETGLLVLDADDAALKHLALPMIQKELQSKGSELAMSRTNAALEALGYPTQVHARPVNLFYLHENQRTRIEVVENGFAVLGTSTTFTTAELLDLSTQYPERFSPNVVTRPLYQEIVLPNIAYIGGPAEVSYWLQLSDVFKWHEVPFPVVMPRYFATIVPGHVLKKMRKLGLEPKDFFANPTDLKAHWLQSRIGDANDLTKEKEKGIAIFEAIKQKAEKNDPSLSSLVEAEKVKFIKQLEYIEKKMQKASEAKETLQIQQLLSLSERIYPGGVLQERVENIFSYLINKPSLIQEMLEVFQPFQYEMHLLYPDENG